MGLPFNAYRPQLKYIVQFSSKIYSISKISRAQ